MENPPHPTAVVGLIAHPHRSLPPGQQYRAHDGRQARARRLRQQARLEAKRLRKQYGSSAVEGRNEEGALLLDFSSQTPVGITRK